MKHKHHIIPKHMGGSDEPYNLMELDRREHGLAHLILYKLYGHREDLWAAQVLLEETMDLKGDKHPMWKGGISADHNAYMREYRKKQPKKPSTPESRAASAKRTSKSYYKNHEERKEKQRIRAAERRRAAGVPERGPRGPYKERTL